MANPPMPFRRNGYEATGSGMAGNNPLSQWDRYQRLEFRDDLWKGAYEFDPETFLWTVKATGQVVRAD